MNICYTLRNRDLCIFAVIILYNSILCIRRTQYWRMQSQKNNLDTLVMFNWRGEPKLVFSEFQNFSFSFLVTILEEFSSLSTSTLYPYRYQETLQCTEHHCFVSVPLSDSACPDSHALQCTEHRCFVSIPLSDSTYPDSHASLCTGHHCSVSVPLSDSACPDSHA